MSLPQVPPRPPRSNHQQAPVASSDMPKVPPRPARQAGERAISPAQDAFPRSPFNEPPGSMVSPSKIGGGLYSSSQNNSNAALGVPERPPSVSLPSIGQEGSEYADIDYTTTEKPRECAVPTGESDMEPREMRNIAGDLPLFAPKPSITKDTAKQRVATVTRTDSRQATAAGIGEMANPPFTTGDHSNLHEKVLKPKVSFQTASPASAERPSSALPDDEHGIPEIGQRVPMYPDAGDVQAPSPSPFQQQFPAGVGFHNSGTAKPSRHHRRTPSGREILPPGSYGMHGHGMQSTDHFEKEWYAKHPDALEREEHGEYGPGIGGGRGEWALSSDDLNKLVRETAMKAQASKGLPNEQTGYAASEEYSSRLQTPQSATFKALHGNHSQPHIESPLRKASFPVEETAPALIRKTRGNDPVSRGNENALESETEDEETHVPAPSSRQSKYTGNGYDPPTENLGPTGGNTEDRGGYLEESGYGVPILASDEVARTPGAEFMQPAVSPVQSRRGSAYYTASDPEWTGTFKSGNRSNSASNSRPSSRPGSMHGVPLSRFSTFEDDRDNMHTPLEDVDEYEPLFPDEEGNKKPMTASQRLKLRETMKRFPSQDIWEDTPNSQQLQATVDTPEPVEALAPPPAKDASSAVFETSAQEAARKGEVSEEDKARLIPKEERLAKSHFQPHIRDEMGRPGIKQRFPSRDIWEDSPDSAELTTTVGGEPTSGLRNPEDLAAEAGAVVQTNGRPKDGIMSGVQERDGATAGAPAMAFEKPIVPRRPEQKENSTLPSATTSDSQQQPSVPSRPPKRLHQVPPADAPVPALPSTISTTGSSNGEGEASPIEGRKGPAIPERAKPQLPSRFAKSSSADNNDGVPLSKVTSTSSVGSDGSARSITDSTGIAKAKPAVPARPTGSKIAAMQGGFLADLNSRLKLGPQAPKAAEKEVEPTEETAPLVDARKGRAKGPARRKPAGTATESSPEKRDASSGWSIYQPVTVWQTDAKGVVQLHTPTSSTTGAGSADDAKDESDDLSKESPLLAAPVATASPTVATAPQHDSIPTIGSFVEHEKPTKSIEPSGSSEASALPNAQSSSLGAAQPPIHDVSAQESHSSMPDAPASKNVEHVIAMDETPITAIDQGSKTDPIASAGQE